jgi:protein TonB
MFSEAMVLTFPHKERGRLLTWPVALSAHLFVLLAVILMPILFPEQVEPRLVKLYLNFAPPPPPPLLDGSPLTLERATDVVPKAQPDEEPEDPNTEEMTLSDRLTLPTEIPEEILKPEIELQYGVEDGSDFGHPFGMESGIPGGVVGGVLGGLLGGVIGGTGTDIPRQRPDVGPQPIRMPRPTYTVEAIRKKVSGEVVLKVIIDVRGKVKVLSVARSIPELDREAIRVVEEEWLFRPATKNGRPIDSVAELVVTFNLY